MLLTFFLGGRLTSEAPIKYGTRVTMSRKDQVKLASFGVFLVAIIFLTSTGDPIIRKAAASTGQMGDGFTGAPDEPTCATIGCHSGALNTGPGRFDLKVERIEGGEDYEVTITTSTTDTTRDRWGFQLTVLRANGRGAGEFMSTDDNTTIVSNSGPTGDRQYIQHTEKGTFKDELDPTRVVWTFRWIPPADSPGPFTFYLAGVQSNGNGRSTGDQVYTPDPKRLFTRPPAAPQITGASLEGKTLFVMGQDFDEEARIALNGKPLSTTPSEDSPTMLLMSKKAGKKIKNMLAADPTTKVILTVVNSDDQTSNSYSFPQDPMN
jgi:Reeler domain